MCKERRGKSKPVANFIGQLAVPCRNYHIEFHIVCWSTQCGNLFSLIAAGQREERLSREREKTRDKLKKENDDSLSVNTLHTHTHTQNPRAAAATRTVPG